jgi:hypothetical protein
MTQLKTKGITMLAAVSMILVIFTVLSTNAAAHTEGDPYTIDLIAGQNLDVGDMKVWNDGDTLYVKYEITEDGWEITETHLAVAESLDDIPQKNGNPAPGQFAYKTDHDPAVTEYTYELDLDWDFDTELYIAAHAVVQKETLLAPAPYYGSSVYDDDQGLRKDGTAVRVGRSNPEAALDFEGGQSETNFFSLGFGGSIIIEFDCCIANGDGNDVKVIEDTWGTGYPLEKAEVYASNDAVTWTYLGTADNSDHGYGGTINTVSEFDLGDLSCAKYIKVVDTTDAGIHNNAADGYDLNAVEALHDCVEIQEETGWGDGEDFPGKNWATYFTYTVQDYVCPIVFQPTNGAQAITGQTLLSEKVDMDLSGTVHIMVRYPYANAPSYFMIYIDTDGDYATNDLSTWEHAVEGWCVDIGHVIYQWRVYEVDVYECGDDLSGTAIDNPENIPYVQHILDQDWVGQTSEGGYGTYTYGDVQRAIWEVVDNSQSTSGLGAWNVNRVNEILADAGWS